MRRTENLGAVTPSTRSTTGNPSAPIPVDGDRFYLARRPVVTETFTFPTSEPLVEGVKCYAGMSDLLIRAAINHECAGLVIETLGSGQVPPGLMPSLRDAVHGGVAVAAVARSPQPAAPWATYYDPTAARRSASTATIGTCARPAWFLAIFQVPRPASNCNSPSARICPRTNCTAGSNTARGRRDRP